MLPETRCPRFSDPSTAVLRRSSEGSHLERFPVAYYLMNPDAAIFYPSCNSINQSSSIPAPSSPPPTLRSRQSRCRRYMRSLQPKTLVLLPLPCIVLILLCLPILLYDIWMDEIYNSPSLSKRGCEFPCPDLEAAETSEDKSSSLPDYEPPSHPLQSIDSVCDLTRILNLDRKLLRNTIAQRDGLLADYSNM